MQITDTIADLLTRIRNATSAKHETVEIPASNMKKAITQILLDEGYIKKFVVSEDGKQGMIKIFLKYTDDKKSVITGLKRVSKPGLRIYSDVENMPKVMKGLGVAIISTSKGVIGRKPINIPAGVEVSLNEGVLTVKGPKGTLTQKIHRNMQVEINDGVITVLRPNDLKQNRALHGLTRSLIHNMVEGVSNGFKKELEVNGVGYRVQKQGSNLVMNLGYSHQVMVPEIEGIKLEAQGNRITVLGADKQKVGQFAAEIREKRPPEPYKGKGIKYVDEVIRRKEGKTGKK